MPFTLPESDSQTAGPERLLLFELGRKRYALPLARVAGLATCGAIRSIPGSPPTVIGLTEWRGRLFTVIDLPAMLGADPDAAPSCLVRLAAPLERTALTLPARVQLGLRNPGEPRIEPSDFDPPVVAERIADEEGAVGLIDPVLILQQIEQVIRKRH